MSVFVRCLIGRACMCGVTPTYLGISKLVAVLLVHKPLEAPDRVQHVQLQIIYRLRGQHAQKRGRRTHEVCAERQRRRHCWGWMMCGWVGVVDRAPKQTKYNTYRSYSRPVLSSSRCREMPRDRKSSSSSPSFPKKYSSVVTFSGSCCFGGGGGGGGGDEDWLSDSGGSSTAARILVVGSRR